MPKKTNFSELQTERYKFKPQLPSVLSKGAPFVQIKQGAAAKPQENQEQIKEKFPNTYGMALADFKKGANSAIKKKKITVGVVLSGGQAPGGHNVIAGLFDGLKKANKKNALIGFIGGPSGIIKDECKILEKDFLHEYRNTGGFDCIQSGRTKIETIEHLLAAKATFQGEKIDALVIIGGDDSNTNAAVIAEFAKKENIPVSVIGVPKTIDGDLKNDLIEASFGFDTATKIYSELAGNICRDANSAQKYWHFIRLMGRSASHITLEVGFKTQPNIVLIGEEVKEKNKTLAQVIDDLAEIVIARAQKGKNFGVVLVPEGLIEFIPEFKELINALNDILSQNGSEFSSAILSDKDKKELASSKLSPHLSALLNSLPNHIAMELLLDRDPHGNVVVSQIETEKLLIGMLKKRLAELK
ncbi:MAG: diphosphate--fructose-6-phosphate 1-phosphotransferase, partial [Endomicrobium sp.]|nr:diphosphate--fructose-6-phosphate 1-phosphotransferase [Endomicrobium sp.]